MAGSDPVPAGWCVTEIGLGRRARDRRRNQDPNPKKHGHQLLSACGDFPENAELGSLSFHPHTSGASFKESVKDIYLTINKITLKE